MPEQGLASAACTQLSARMLSIHRLVLLVRNKGLVWERVLVCTLPELYVLQLEKVERLGSESWAGVAMVDRGSSNARDWR